MIPLPPYDPQIPDDDAVHLVVPATPKGVNRHAVGCEEAINDRHDLRPCVLVSDLLSGKDGPHPSELASWTRWSF